MSFPATRSVYSKAVTVTATATPAAVESSQLIASVIVRARSDNSGYVELRPYSQTSGARLAAGEEAVFRSIDLAHLAFLSENGTEVIDILGDLGAE